MWGLSLMITATADILIVSDHVIPYGRLHCGFCVQLEPQDFFSKV